MGLFSALCILPLQGGTDSSPSISSLTLENVYLADREVQIPFTVGKQKYILFFIGKTGQQQMYQQNVQFNTIREVRRRPHFVSTHEVEVKLKRYFYALRQTDFLRSPCILNVLDVSVSDSTAPMVLLCIPSAVHQQTAPALPQLQLSQPTGTRMPYLTLDARYPYSMLCLWKYILFHH